MDEFARILQESLSQVERQLAMEDQGWIRAGTQGQIITDMERVQNMRKSRMYALKDPLAQQAIRLWTDYAFGTGMTWACEDESISEVLKGFWDAKANQPLLGASGQRKSSDKLLVDGEVFLAVFPSPDGRSTVRRIDPLEITEIITDPDDSDDVRFYKREWFNRQNSARVSYYRSADNIHNAPCPDYAGAIVQSDQPAVVFHLAINSLGERGNSILTASLEWIRLYRQFMASRVAIMLAMARFAWKLKVSGGPGDVLAAQSEIDGKSVGAGQVWVENQGAEMIPIRADSGAAQAYHDGRMLKLQICSGVGWPEQYFGDLSTGNLATAKTVELPVSKMCQSYQRIWSDFYAGIDGFILDQAGMPAEGRDIDRDFPSITPEDQVAMAASIQQVVQTLPVFADSRDVRQQALMSIGVLDTNRVLDDIEKLEADKAKEQEQRGADMPGWQNDDPALGLSRALAKFRVAQQPKGDSDSE